MASVQHRFGTASARYSSVDLSSRIEGASPHQLVTILFEELLKALDQCAAAAARKDFTRLGEAQSRALSMIFGLQTGLDLKRGGEIARNLAAIYVDTTERTKAAARECDAAELMKVREMIGEIAGAWDVIG